MTSESLRSNRPELVSQESRNVVFKQMLKTRRDFSQQNCLLLCYVRLSKDLIVSADSILAVFHYLLHRASMLYLTLLSIDIQPQDGPVTARPAP